MKKESIFTGKTVEEALSNGLAELGLDADSVTYEVIEHEKKGLLGFGASPAKIKIVCNEKKDGEEIAVAYVKKLLESMNIEADVSFEKATAGRYKLSVNGEGAGLLIGHHGDTLDALQYLVSLAVNKREEDGQKGEYMNITLDAENYREKREEALKSLARRMAAKVLKYRRSVVLEPMLPYERRIIHAEVQTIDGVATNSIGLENNRKVVIFLEEVGFEKSMERDGTQRRPQKARRDGAADGTAERVGFADRSKEGFKSRDSRDGSGRSSDRGGRNDRDNRGERVGFRNDRKPGAARKTPESIVEKIEKKLPKITNEELEDGDFSYSSTAYLREPTKRFSSFAEYESHMAELESTSDKEKTADDKGTEE